MKISIFSGRWLVAVGMTVANPVSSLLAAETSGVAQSTAAPQQVITTSAAVKLPYGADDVLKLSRAQISEDVILNYVQGSGTIYNLAPKDIVYLRNEGVSDKVINAMLGQRRLADVTAQTASQMITTTVPNAAVVANAPMVATAPSAPVAPQYVEADPTYVEQAPAPSSLYVIPSPTVRAAYYGYYSPYAYSYPYGYCAPSYYGSYYGGFYGPSISLGFRFGGHGGFHGHGHGGWRR